MSQGMFLLLAGIAIVVWCTGCGVLCHLSAKRIITLSKEDDKRASENERRAQGVVGQVNEGISELKSATVKFEALGANVRRDLNTAKEQVEKMKIEIAQANAKDQS